MNIREIFVAILKWISIGLLWLGGLLVVFVLVMIYTHKADEDRRDDSCPKPGMRPDPIIEPPKPSPSPSGEPWQPPITAPPKLIDDDVPPTTTGPERTEPKEIESEQQMLVTRNWYFIEIALCILIFAFGAFVLQKLGAIIDKSPDKWSPRFTLKSFGLVLVIVGALVLVAAGYSVQQISPAMGLLGAIAGYLLGTGEQKHNDGEK